MNAALAGSWRVVVQAVLPSGGELTRDTLVSGVGPARALTLAEDEVLTRHPGAELDGAWCYFAGDAGATSEGARA